MDKTNNLYNDLGKLLDYTRRKEVSAEDFISGSQNRVDKILELSLNYKSKSHLLLQQASLNSYDKRNVIGTASGSYDFHRVSAALRIICRNTIRSSATHATSSTELDTRAAPHRQRLNRRGGNGRSRERNWRTCSSVERVTRKMGTISIVTTSAIHN